MPPKKQITKEQILETAFTMVQKDGVEHLSVRNLAKELNCSTQPIYLSYRDMGELKYALAQKAVDRMLFYVKRNKENEENPLLAKVLGYIQFACEEKKLYQLLYSTDVMSMNHTEQMVSFTDEVELNLMIYANGLIMMKTFGTLNLTWNQIKKMVGRVYHSFETAEK